MIDVSSAHKCDSVILRTDRYGYPFVCLFVRVLIRVRMCLCVCLCVSLFVWLSICMCVRSISCLCRFRRYLWHCGCVGLQRCFAICIFAYTCAALSQMPSAFFVSHLAHGRRAGLRFLFSPCKYEAYVFMPLLAICLGSCAARHVDAMRSLRRTRKLGNCVVGAWRATVQRIKGARKRARF